MITKAVTEDLYGNTHIYRYPIYTYSEKISTKCSKCGKRIDKTVSIQYQDKPSKEDYARLEERKQAWLSEEHVCNKCLKQACKGEQHLIDTSDIEAAITVIQDRRDQINELLKSVSIHCKLISERLKGKVCLYNDKEYVINYVSYTDFGYYLYAYKVDERNPWTTTERELYINDTGCGYGGCKSENCKFSEVTFTDEVFSDRRKRLEEFERV